MDYFNRETADRVEKILSDMKNQNIDRLDQPAYEAMVQHITQAVERIKAGAAISLPKEPVPDHVKTTEEYAAARKLIAAIQKEFRIILPAAEASSLMLHIMSPETEGIAYTAASPKSENTEVARIVNIGVVCASGFGLAKLMCARLEEKLGSGVALKAYGVCDLTPTVVERTDFFVSALDLDYVEIEYIRVSPMINLKDQEALESRIQKYAYTDRERTVDTTFLQRLEELHFISGEVMGIINRYHSYPVEPNVTFEQLLEVLADKTVEEADQKQQVMKGLHDREEMGSQIFEEIGISLLHCRTQAVDEAMFISCIPKNGGRFTDPYMKETKAAILLLLPSGSHETEYGGILGSISAGLIQEAAFLPAIMEGREVDVKNILINRFREYIKEKAKKL